MDHLSYLGLIPLARALDEQAAVAADVARGGAGRVLAFEAERIVTLGLRGCAERDLFGAARGVPVLRVDRGGQATLHNPGQLVIFPVWSLGGLGSRAWVERLIGTTQAWADCYGRPLTWREDAPGLYDADGGKVVSIGIRVRRGVSTHGLAINVTNDLGDFALIRPCGRAGQAVAHLGVDVPLEDLARAWADVFTVLGVGPGAREVTRQGHDQTVLRGRVGREL